MFLPFFPSFFSSIVVVSLSLVCRLLVACLSFCLSVVWYKSYLTTVNTLNLLVVLLVTSPVVFKCEIAVRISRSVSPVSPDSFPMDETNDPRGIVVPLKFPSFQLAFNNIWINSRVVLMSVYHSQSRSPRLSFM